MSGFITPQLALWALGVAAQLGLFALLFLRGNRRVLPWFSTYLLLNLAQVALLWSSYRVYGYSSPVSWWIYWISQGFVTVGRLLAVAELWRRILGAYCGIWTLAWRLLAGCAAIAVLLFLFAVSRSWQLAVLRADRGLEFTIALTVVLLFLFTYYYEVQVGAPERILAVGFCLFSCFSVLNLTILEALPDAYTVLWNILASAAHLSTLLLWIWALRRKLPETLARPALFEESVYHQLSPKINARLELMNDYLLAIWRPEAPRP